MKELHIEEHVAGRTRGRRGARGRTGPLRPLVFAAVVIASDGCDELVGLGPPSDAGLPPLHTGQLVTLASGQGLGLWGVAADETHVYWTTEDSVLSVRFADGGTPTTLATEPDAGPEALVVDATNVYWLGNNGTSEEGFVMKVPLQGGTPVTLASAKGEPNFIAVDATSVYWTMGLTQAGGSGGALMKVGIEGGTPTTLATGPEPFGGVAVDASSAYYYDGNLRKVPLGGGAPVTVATGQSVSGNISIDASNVYWAASSAIMSLSLGGGEPTTLASGLIGASAIAIDASRVYWLDEDFCDDGGSCGGNAVVTVPLNGGAPKTLFSGLGLGQIAVAGSGLFWTSQADNGSVMALPFD